jgi:3-oxoacyl-(acyl-carrier-protein) synthase
MKHEALSPGARAAIDPVVVTGIGVVSPAGCGASDFWNGILQGRSYTIRRTNFPDSAPGRRAAGVAPFEPETLFSWTEAPVGELGDRLFRIAEAVIAEALDHSGIRGSSAEAALVQAAGLYVASAIGPIAAMEHKVRGFGTGAPDERGHHPFSFGRIAARLAARFGLGGPYATVPTGCAGGCDAVGYALAALRSGAASCAIVGGFEAPLTPLVEAAFARINATSSRDCAEEEASCPFDVRRDGFVLGEGGSALVLERESTALARGARPLAILAGYASTSSGFHMTDIHDSGEAIARSIELALDDAGLAPGEVDHVNLHGSSTPMNDLAEANALRTVLGERAERTPVTSVKSQIGHALAAANSIELAAAVMTLTEQLIPPTANFREPDPRIGLDVVSPAARPAQVDVLVKTASGFGGIHSALVLRRYR